VFQPEEDVKMGRIQVRIKAPFGDVVIEADNPQEVLETLRSMPPQFMDEISDLISTKLTPPVKAQLEGIVEFTTDGPIITTRKNLTHYEAIGLILYASEEKKHTVAQIAGLLEASGIKAMIPGRLNEMTKRGIVFKPDSAKPEWQLTTKGEKWIEEEVLTKLKS
jgi:hypothetical protein